MIDMGMKEATIWTFIAQRANTARHIENDTASSLTSCNGNLLHTLQEKTVFSEPELTTQVLASDGWSLTLA
jgi:hypothetical protein